DKTAQGSASRANAMNMRPSLWELSCEANELWLLTGDNLLETDECYLANFAARLERAEIRGLRDLIAADNVLELTFAPHPRTMLVHRRVLEKVKAFINHYPQLLEISWVHSQGCIAEVMHEMKHSTAEAAAVLARYRL
ncbi:hypothetical protein ACQUZK_09400, partial [Streptococcus pyogenes]|uniref:hypothetical protein n=1 Tax=Streptococcus pyogenes TaxID=1314 RepID=UPI003DA0286A